MKENDEKSIYIWGTRESKGGGVVKGLLVAFTLVLSIRIVSLLIYIYGRFFLPYELTFESDMPMLFIHIVLSLPASIIALSMFKNYSANINKPSKALRAVTLTASTEALLYFVSFVLSIFQTDAMLTISVILMYGSVLIFDMVGVALIVLNTSYIVKQKARSNQG